MGMQRFAVLGVLFLALCCLVEHAATRIRSGLCLRGQNPFECKSLGSWSGHNCIIVVIPCCNVSLPLIPGQVHMTCFKV